MTPRPCPTCKNPVNTEDNPFLPFCSERCKLIDLGKWAAGEYRIAGPPVNLPEVREEESMEDA